MAGLLEKTGKGRFRITERGKEILSTNPTVINMHLLQQFPEYAHARTKGKDAASVDSAVTETKTPQERMASALAELNEALMTDLRTKLATIDPFRFEQVVLQLLQKMGYGDWHEKAAIVTQKG